MQFFHGILVESDIRVHAMNVFVTCWALLGSIPGSPSFPAIHTRIMCTCTFGPGEEKHGLIIMCTYYDWYDQWVQKKVERVCGIVVIHKVMWLMSILNVWPCTWNAVSKRWKFERHYMRRLVLQTVKYDSVWVSRTFSNCSIQLVSFSPVAQSSWHLDYRATCT